MLHTTLKITDKDTNMSNEQTDKPKLYVVEYGGFFHIQTEPFYGNTDVLDADEVGYDAAKKFAQDLVDAYNEKTGNV